MELALLKAPDVATGADRTEILRALDAELRAITHQVDELLQLARADAAGDEAVAHAERLFLDDLVADELPRWQPQAEQLGVALTVGALEEAAVRGDAVLLARLCGVLVDNALRYSGTPGNVRVSVQARTDVVVLTVEDNGRGVPVADRVRIFDRFFRAEQARHRRADEFGTVLLKGRQRGLLIGVHEAVEPNHLCRHDCSEPTLHPLLAHSGTPATHFSLQLCDSTRENATLPRLKILPAPIS